MATTYTDGDGWRWRVEVPAGSEDRPETGVVLGPPDVRDALPDLPPEFARRLHDELFNRGLFTMADVRRRPAELGAALQAAYRVDLSLLRMLYQQG